MELVKRQDLAVHRFEDILVWQKAQDLSVLIYQNFSNNKDLGFCNQITRASVSISNNIDEGFERRTNPDFTRFLYFALASNSEVRSMPYLSQRLNFLNEASTKELINTTNEISKMLYGLIKSMSKSTNS